MMWAYAIKSKITAAILLCVVLVMVLLTNFSERSNSNKVHEAAASMYEDRLVVEGYIFNYSRSLQRISEILKKTEHNTSLQQQKASIELSNINKLNSLYRKTKLTRDEAISFEAFTLLCQTMQKQVNMGKFEDALASALKADAILNTLSGIQITEARSQMDNLNKLSSFSSLLSQIEMGALIIIALLLQVLVFSSKTLQKVPLYKNTSLN